MTRDEWLEIGYDKKIIEDYCIDECMIFSDCFNKWFCMKMQKVRGSTLDRIEVTYSRYFANSCIKDRYIHEFSVEYICSFFNDIIVNNFITLKEFQRIYQIVNNVLCYALDMNYGYAPLIDWNKVKRYVYNLDIEKHDTIEHFISQHDRNILFNSVLRDNILPDKKNTCLLLLLNFYLGLRLGELSALSFSDFDLQHRVVHIRRSESKCYSRDDVGLRGVLTYEVNEELKTVNACRNVPLVDNAIYIYKLIEYNHQCHNYQSPYLCFDGSEMVYSYCLTRTLKRLCKLCGINPINTHLIRKTFASELHNSGVPTRVISDILGHSEIETTEKYYILSSDDFSEYYKLLNSACNKISTIRMVDI